MALKKEDHRSLKPGENVIADPTHPQMGRRMKDSLDYGMDRQQLL